MNNTPAKYIYLNGDIVPFEEAKIHILSVGITYAATVFEGLRAYWKPEDRELYVFRLESHVRRLLNSIRLSRMQSKLSEGEIKDSIIQVLKKNNFQEDVHLRQMAFIEGIGPMSTTEPVGLAVAAIPSYRFFDPEKGISCAVSSWTRISDCSSPPRIKCTANYQNSRLAFLQAKSDGYDNAILLNQRGKVSEGPAMCLFLVREGKVITPTVTSDILESITRSTIIQLFKEYCKIKVIERDVDRTELYLAEELFFCGTAVEVLPIISVDRHMIGKGKVGEMTRKIQKTYNDIVRGNIPDHPEWRTAVQEKM
jgi:branched-chain amino acid aminotransferase